MQITIQMTVIFEEGGSQALTEGMSWMYPRTMVAMRPILLDKSLSWKKMARERRESKRIGMKMVKSELEGYLQSGMMKWVYWLQLGFVFFYFFFLRQSYFTFPKIQFVIYRNSYFAGSSSFSFLLSCSKGLAYVLLFPLSQCFLGLGDTYPLPFPFRFCCFLPPLFLSSFPLFCLSSCFLGLFWVCQYCLMISLYESRWV